MTSTLELPCEACGQPASPEHIARRLLRLEWATRYRPVHIQALLVSAVAPEDDADFLYSPEGRFQGEGGELLDALEISREGKSADEVLTEFQKRGLFLIHVLECPLAPGQAGESLAQLLERQIRPTLARIRRSIKPKRVVILSPELSVVQSELTESQLGAPAFVDHGRPFALPLIGTSREEFLRVLSAAVVG